MAKPARPPRSSADRIAKVAASLHAGLGQTLIGLAMLAKCHANALADRRDPEAKRAREIQRLLARAVVQVHRIIRTLDRGQPR